MKLYSFHMAPNGLRATAFLAEKGLAEKGLDVPVEQVDLVANEAKRMPFLSKNSLGEIPVLELDDGRLITESVAICRYLEDIQPEPRLMGVSPFEAARVEMWNRRMEQQIFGPMFQIALHTFEFFADRIEQVPAYAETQKRVMARNWKWLDRELSDGRTFVCDDRFSIADITGMAALMVCDIAKMPVPEDLANVTRWQAAMRARPSWAH